MRRAPSSVRSRRSPRASRARIIAEGREVDPDRFQAGVAQRLQRGGDHVAAGGDDDHVDLRRHRRRRPATPPTTRWSITACSSGIAICSWAAKRTADVELLRVLDRRQPQRPHDDALVGDAEPDPVGELVLGEERAQRLGDRVGVGDLAVVEGPGGKRGDRRSPRGARTPLVHDLGRGDAAGLDLEADQRRRPCFLLSCKHRSDPGCIDRSAAEPLAGCYLELEKVVQDLDSAHPTVSRPITQADFSGSMKLGGSM